MKAAPFGVNRCFAFGYFLPVNSIFAGSSHGRGNIADLDVVSLRHIQFGLGSE